MTIESFCKRYRIEPRGEAGGGWGCKSYLVVYDKNAQDYVRAEGSKRAYARFSDSNEVFNWAIYREERECERNAKRCLAEVS